VQASIGPHGSAGFGYHTALPPRRGGSWDRREGMTSRDRRGSVRSTCARCACRSPIHTGRSRWTPPARSALTAA